MTKEIKNKYGLMHIKKDVLIGYSIEAAAEDADGVSEIHSLVLSTDYNSFDFWYVDNPKYAEWVRLNHTEWYNADHDTPRNHFVPDDLQVVKINVTITAKPVSVKIPTPYHVYKAKYAKTQKRHWNSIQEHLKSGEMELSLYELMQYYENQEKRKKGKK